ncbi:hypothetical protein [Kribbella sp. NPDC051770]|uniref:hypothetical protein n=1 Tax=Kribbella sp. NPDC051770 TaxID=3155413 RepID=UPI00341D1E7C
MHHAPKVRRLAIGLAVAAIAGLAPATVQHTTQAVAVTEQRHSVAGQLVSTRRITDLDPALAAVAARADRITYRSRALTGDDIVVSGALFTPKGRPPKHGWPIVS